MTEVRTQTTVTVVANGATQAVALEAAAEDVTVHVQSLEKGRSPEPGRALLHHVADDHAAGIAGQDHEAGTGEVLVGVVVAETVVEVIGALTTTMRTMDTGSTLLTWTAMLASETWRS